MTDPHADRWSRPPPLSVSDALFLDFDGTLADIAPQPDRVVIATHLPPLLTALYARLGGAVAVITGRRLADVDALLAPVVLPGAGVHGAELRLRVNEPTHVLQVDGIAPLVQALREQFSSDPRLLVEDKTAAVALHFRLAPERASECIQAMRVLAAAHNLDTVVGSRVVEARAPGVHKGNALRKLALHRPFSGRRPAFVGDDSTDEDGFTAAQELGGYGVKVGAGKTAARYRCRTVDNVHTWLRSGFQPRHEEVS